MLHDPNEVNNLWSDPNAASMKQELLGVLREWRIRSGIETANWSQDWR
jgi:hypothetical protein